MPKQSVNQVTVKTEWETLHCWRIFSLLTPGQTALIQFIPIFMSADIKAQTTQLTSDMFDYSVDREPDVNYALIQRGLEYF